MSCSTPTVCLTQLKQRRHRVSNIFNDRRVKFSDIINVINSDPSIESLRQLPTEEKLEFASRAGVESLQCPTHTYYLLQVLMLLKGADSLSSHSAQEGDKMADYLSRCLERLSELFRSMDRLDLCDEMHNTFGEMSKKMKISISPAILIAATLGGGALVASTILLYRSIV